MSEIAPQPTPTDNLVAYIDDVILKAEKEDATEITLTNTHDGSWYWIRRINGQVQQMVCRRPRDTTGEIDIERGASLELGKEYELLVTTNQWRSGYSPEDIDSGFEIPLWGTPLNYNLMLELLEELMATDEIETDVDEERLESPQPKNMAKAAIFGALIADGAIATTTTIAMAGATVLGMVG